MARRLPTIFMNHGGGPMPLLGEPSHAPMTASMKNLVSRLQITSTLRAILIISAHWEGKKFTTLTAASSQSPVPLYFDYSGFPAETYQYKYSPPGAPDLAKRVVSLLDAAGLPAEEDPGVRKGYDHGVFVPLLLSFPEANIAVVQMSLKEGLSAEEHIKCGQALAPLREEGVLLYGSGMSYHNMSHFMGGGSGNEDSIKFDNWLTETLSHEGDGKRLERLARWEEDSPSARQCHPREEHLAPLFVVAGAAGNDTPCSCTFSGDVLGQKVSSFAFEDAVTLSKINL